MLAQFAPQIFQVMGMGVKASLLSSMITNSVNLVATFVAIYVVDRQIPAQPTWSYLGSSPLDSPVMCCCSVRVASRAIWPSHT